MRIEAGLYRQTLDSLIAAGGVDEAQALTLADNLSWCDMAGRRNHGIERLPILLQRVATGAIKCPCSPVFIRSQGAIRLLDADGGFGHHAGHLAMEQACELAVLHGVGVVGVRNSNFYGAGAYYAKLAAERQMVGLALSNSFPKVAAHGGTRAVLGTNPFAFAAPRENGRNVIVDMSTAAMAGSSVREAIAQGVSLAEGLAVDCDGNALRDPAEVGKGTLLPAAGAKGFGLAILVETLSGVITGAGIAGGVASMYKDLDRPGHNGHFLLAIDIAKLMPIDEYWQRAELLFGALLATDPDHPVRLPGDARWDELETSKAQGVEIDDKTLDAIERLGAELGVSVGWS